VPAVAAETVNKEIIALRIVSFLMIILINPFFNLIKQKAV
jgi:hypothetical protein